MKKRTLSVVIRVILLCLCVAVVVGGTGYIIRAAREYRRARGFYESLAGGTVERETEPQEADETEETKRLRSLHSMYQSAKEAYSAVIGYIRIAAADICYPVVQGTDNTYYMSHLVSGEENSSGSIFIDFRCQNVPWETNNMVIYGHNMNNRTMFHNLENLFEEDVFDRAEVEYICDAGYFIYEPYSVYVTTTADPYYQMSFADTASYLSFLEGVRSKLHFGVRDFRALTQDENCITLVTCSNSSIDPEQRYVFHGLLKDSVIFAETYGEQE